jgi:UDP-N-acetylglucosamine 2-epimerase (non-hydrolysing)
MNKTAIRPLIVFGTRPEAIKLAPLIHQYRQHVENFEPIVCNTGQHRELVDQIIDYFELEPHENLAVMQPNQSLTSLTSELLTRLDQVVDKYQPDCIVAQGDTTSVMTASMLAFYRRIPFVHVEAGLRTNDIYSPWPEEFNRRVSGLVANVHCAPTGRAVCALLNEGIDRSKIFLTGNTVIDALMWSVEQERENDAQWREKYRYLGRHRVVVITAHRRESFGEGFSNICRAILQLAEKFPDVQFVYPVHLNPNVQQPVRQLLGDCANIHLLPPASYPEFIWLMDRCDMLLTDSGGVQEEAPSLRKPTLVLRQTTEREEAVEAGAVQLVGTDVSVIVGAASRLLTDSNAYRKMQVERSPFGDGLASKRICQITAGLFQRELREEFACELTVRES